MWLDAAENCAKQETNEWITSIEGNGIKRGKKKNKLNPGEGGKL